MNPSTFFNKSYDSTYPSVSPSITQGFENGSLALYQSNQAYPQCDHFEEEIIDEIDYLTKIIQDLILEIFNKCSPKEIGRLGMLSKSYEVLANNDELWQSICKAEKSDIANIYDLAWKQIYVQEIDLSRFLGGKLVLGRMMGKIFPIDVNVEHEALNGRQLKIITQRQLRLTCDLEDFTIIVNGKRIDDLTQIKSLKLQKSDDCRLFIYTEDIFGQGASGMY